LREDQESEDKEETI